MFWTRTRSAHPAATCGNPLEMFSRLHRHHAPRGAAAYPAVNLWADDNGAVLTSEIPGVALTDLEITVSGKNMTIKGSRQREESEDSQKFIRGERAHGMFERTITLPFQIDAATVAAKLVNGVLEVTLPRAENDKPRKIDIAGN